MDNYAHSDGFDSPDGLASSANDATAMELGGDERRMHVRAYNYWASLLGERDFPSIEDLDPGSVADFGPHSVLLDFTGGRDNPATPFIGAALRIECGLEGDVRAIADVPSRSLLSRLTDHYLQIIANRAPIGFEAEFVNQAGRTICYRGILMPFSSDGETIDFIYGVINWKDGDSEPVSAAPALTLVDRVAEHGSADEADMLAPHLAREVEPLNDTELPDVVLDSEAGLADHLSAARDGAELCKQHDGRSRAALYRTLAMAYDFAVATRRATDDYAEILEDAGIKRQERAPMTPIVKLVFGIDYDKTRLTEFAAALSFAERSATDFGGFLNLIERQPGGLKALVAAERLARRPVDNLASGDEVAREKLRHKPAVALCDLPSEHEFALVLVRRNAAGIYEPIGLVDEAALVDRLIRRSSLNS